MKVKVMVSLCCAVLFAVIVLSVLPVNGEEKIYSDLVRLHVIANSDSDEDQALKLKVRDAVLSEACSLDMGTDKESAQAVLSANRERLCAAARRTVEAEGYTYDVCVELGSEKYPERTYEDFVLPAGTYTSLRVIIGEGNGHNWWCVLYPPLCTSTAEEREETFIAAGFTDEQYKAITDGGKTKYKVKFKIVEILEEIFG
ncbi:MAG: stage II sporulation protein R [Candidatus Avispirillum sp.]